LDIIKAVLNFLSLLFTDVVFAITMYYLCISFFGIIKIKDKKFFAAQKVFALIVAAHNEETVISDVIVSLKRLDYPKELYDIFVIADNCTDFTAVKARKEGALVYERQDKVKTGKGSALEWMFGKLFNLDKYYDAIVVFDADNLVSKNFLTEMNKKLCEGYNVVQGYLDSKNPSDTWITRSYSIAYWSTNRMFQLSRSNLGLSNQLGGTGFCVETDTLKKIGWGATCLTEDLEFTCKLVLNGYRVGWAHDAVIYDEKPLTLKQSWWQRKRWMQGFADVSSRYFFKLLYKSIRQFDLKALDCALYSIQPIITVLMGISMIVGLIQNILVSLNFISGVYINSFNITQGKIALSVLAVIQFIYTPFILILEKKFNFKVFLYYLIYPIYTLTWIPISFIGIIHKNDKEWNHTAHTRSVSITDLEKAN
jgi:cellulose synthase/poly-beta-1,6-N-acetylglucosamine synthase-like glycosyltransferase